MTERDDEAVSKFIERFALVLADSGVPRMPARVFVALLASENGQLTAGELAEQLSVSPAAVSGAVRYLTQVHLIVREREPGSKRDHYRVRGNSWYESAMNRERLLTLWSEALLEGVDAVGRSTDAGSRLRESVEFFEFLRVEIPMVLERWRSRNATN
ncbi:GbsR/MarR family transcriptional regulator [Kutzneria sp. CA-103260]|uniref:GbsR/MarR family transcriptional regulator n=1 Tax=Kutzneria sp. CA-103260 TaxID=2802641 RepID=UPI001BF148AD|nr:MarR family transcriptional regulator [Kutzneria sp. CA-103260]QUQ68890.1 MarR family transcriptional regulator [Kutzneria sp. CA-103260]